MKKTILILLIMSLVLFGMSNTSVLVSETYIYKTVNGQALELDIYQPINVVYDQTPVVVYIHGGGFTSGDKDVLLDPKRSYQTQAILEAGFAIVSVNYRLCDDDTHMPTNYEDAKDAIRWVYKEADSFNFDTENIGVWGSSAGGNMALMMAYSDNLDFKGDEELYSYNSHVNYVINLNGPTLFSEWTDDPKVDQSLNTLFGLNERDDAYADQFSPVTYVTNDTVPTLTMHGTLDTTVDVSQAYILNDAFVLEENYNHHLYIFENKEHGVKAINQEERDFQSDLMVDFIETNYDRVTLNTSYPEVTFVEGLKSNGIKSINWGNYYRNIRSLFN